MKRALIIVLAGLIVVIPSACKKSGKNPTLPPAGSVATDTPTFTPTLTASSTASSTHTRTVTPTFTPTATRTTTHTNSITWTGTPTATCTTTLTRTCTSTATVTATATPYPTTCFWGQMNRNGSIGPRINNSSSSNATQFTLGSAATVYRLSIKLGSYNACSVRMGIYSDLSNAPSARLALSPWVNVTDTTSATFTYTSTLSSPVALPAGTYWLACEVYSASLCDFFMARYTVVTNNATLHGGAALGDPFPAGASQTNYTNPFTIWADLCP